MPLSPIETFGDASRVIVMDSRPPPLSPSMRRLCHNPLFVIASDRRERGNLLFFNKLQIASVAVLPRNDIMTQPLKKGGLFFDKFESVVFTIAFCCFSVSHVQKIGMMFKHSL